jgi:two-component sensor histidine kinase
VAARTSTYPEDAAQSLTLAVVTSSSRPLLLLDGKLNVVAASATFCQAFELDAAKVAGRELMALGDGEWNIPQLRSLLDATASGAAKIEAYEIELRRPGREDRRLVIHAQRLVYLDLENLRLLVAVCDVTEALADKRLMDDALNQNDVLLQEVRHRVANSLQIIASVLLQTARRTHSEETRGHLKDAHHRVMSIAALERQLSTTGDGEVYVHAYFTALCGSIAASMIADGELISLSVTGGDGLVAGRVSVSLGLIVTELAINALKHAFPDGRPGKITVDYDFHGPNWVLCVTDDGVGMPSGTGEVHVGLGTSIVQALAKQLQATIETTATYPGTKITIRRNQIALVEEIAGSAANATAIVKPAA